MELVFSLAGIYLFVVIGYASKHFFKEKIEEGGFVLVSVYFLQPILTFWSLLQQKIDSTILLAPIAYMAIVLAFVVMILFQRRLLSDSKDKNLLVATSIIGNTGNLGIPLGLALYGHESLVYTSLINIANVFIVYTIGVYYYSKGEASAKESLLNIIKLPILWFALLALILNYYDFTLSEAQNLALTMGAYACVVIQLMIFGIYLKQVEIKKLNYRLQTLVNLNKLILLPLLGVVVLWFVDMSVFVKIIIIIQLATPIAVNNVNLAALYKSKPNETASLIFVTSVLFLMMVFVDIYIVKTVF